MWLTLFQHPAPLDCSASAFSTTQHLYLAEKLFHDKDQHFSCTLGSQLSNWSTTVGYIWLYIFHHHAHQYRCQVTVPSTVLFSLYTADCSSRNSCPTDKFSADDAGLIANDCSHYRQLSLWLVQAKPFFSECTQDEMIINFRQKKPNYTPIVVKPGVDQMDKYSY